VGGGVDTQRPDFSGSRTRRAREQPVCHCRRPESLRQFATASGVAVTRLATPFRAPCGHEDPYQSRGPAVGWSRLLAEPRPWLLLLAVSGTAASLSRHATRASRFGFLPPERQEARKDEPSIPPHPKVAEEPREREFPFGITHNGSASQGGGSGHAGASPAKGSTPGHFALDPHFQWLRGRCLPVIRPLRKEFEPLPSGRS